MKPVDRDGLATVADARSSAWLRTAVVLTVVAALLPGVVLGGDQLALVGVMATSSARVLILVIVLLFCYSHRTWAADELDPARATDAV